MSATLSLADLYRPIEDPLQGVREVVQQLWNDALRLVNLEGMPSPRLGGKMLRPALCLLSAGAIGARDLRKYVRLGAAFESLHIASLAHDDVIDRAILRRGSAALNALWDNHAAVLGGDYLVARAVELLCEFNCCPVVANAIASVRRMAEGELHFFGRDENATTEADCIQLAEHKTASLFAEACAAPAWLIDQLHRAALHRFGTALGVAFQIVDDLIDVTQPEETLGKPSCGDVVEGKPTLPLMFLRDSLDPAGRTRLRGFRETGMTDDDRAWVMEQVERSGARAQTEAIARRHADEAQECLATLPDTPYRDSMGGLVEFVMIRVS